MSSYTFRFLTPSKAIKSTFITLIFSYPKDFCLDKAMDATIIRIPPNIEYTDNDSPNNTRPQVALNNIPIYLTTSTITALVFPNAPVKNICASKETTPKINNNTNSSTVGTTKLFLINIAATIVDAAKK